MPVRTYAATYVTSIKTLRFFSRKFNRQAREGFELNSLLKNLADLQSHGLRRGCMREKRHPQRNASLHSLRSAELPNTLQAEHNPQVKRPSSDWRLAFKKPEFNEEQPGPRASPKLRVVKRHTSGLYSSDCKARRPA